MTEERKPTREELDAAKKKYLECERTGNKGKAYAILKDLLKRYGEIE